jgi:hypothetical protein
MHAKFLWEDFGKRIPESVRRSWEDNIKMDLNKNRVVGGCGLD